MFEPDGPTMGKGYERIQKRLYAIDEWAEYQELEANLRLDVEAHRADYATLLDALEAGEDNARRAHRLYVNAKVALEAFEIDAQVVEGGMREQAVDALQQEKAAGLRTKAITNDDVAAYMAAKFPDQHRDLEMRRAKAKRMCEHFERLAELWRSRSRSLDTMVSTQRR